MVLLDSYARPLLNMRIAVTRRCNLKCEFCHEEGELVNRESRDNEMTPAEIGRIMGVAVGLGISRVKLTGGEPLIRKDITEIVKMVSAVDGVSDLSMTTNGTLLPSLASSLRACGLNRVNISLPTLRSDVYARLTGGMLDNALAGVDAAVKAGLDPVKLNVLALKGVSKRDFLDMINFAGKTGAVLQLIELEPINIDSEYYANFHEPLDDYEQLLKEKAVSVQTRRYMQNRRVYDLPEAKVEVVHPIENSDFCDNCTRLRVTSDGMLKPCLMRNDGLVDILTPIRNGATNEEIMERFTFANTQRRPYFRYVK